MTTHSSSNPSKHVHFRQKQLDFCTSNQNSLKKFATKNSNIAPETAPSQTKQKLLIPENNERKTLFPFSLQLIIKICHYFSIFSSNPKTKKLKLAENKTKNPKKDDNNEPLSLSLLKTFAHKFYRIAPKFNLQKKKLFL